MTRDRIKSLGVCSEACKLRDELLRLLDAYGVDDTDDLLGRIDEWSALESEVHGILDDNGLESTADLMRLVEAGAKLPKTADGVPITLEMDVFWTGEGFSDEARSVIHSASVRGVSAASINAGGSPHHPHNLSSTRAAAEAARKEGE